jgi:hypothetical protein
LTLVEVLISVAILATGAGMVLQALARGAHALATARHRATAYAFSAAKLADVRQRLDQGTLDKTAGEFRSGTGQYRWDVATSPLAIDPVSGAPMLELVTLTVGWTQGRHDYAEEFAYVRRVPGAVR